MDFGQKSKTTQGGDALKLLIFAIFRDFTKK
jgi:hypothetical protein